MAAEPSMLDALTDSPYLLPGAGLLAALLAGLGFYRYRNRADAKRGSDSSFLESRVQPDSFFGASGGQRVDTSDASAGSSSMGFSLSQLDAIGDVDPVAEADVYLAYGRDLQAEEILKEAMRANPDRLAVRTKLLEVYAKRRDTKGFELLAVQLFSLTKGTGPDWEKAQSMGLSIDPENPLYQPGGHPEEILRDGDKVFVEPLGATTLPASAGTTGAPSGFLPSQPAESEGGSIDLDLDLDLGAVAEPPPGAMETTRALSTDAVPGVQTTQPLAASAAPADDLPPMDFDLGDLSLDLPPVAPPTAAPAAPVADPKAEEPILDFGDFQVSAEGPLSEPVPFSQEPELPPDADDPISRKLELAEEFRQIGDLEGARDLLEEVVSKSQGSLKTKAQTMLDELG